MGKPRYLIALTSDEEKIVQMLTRDAASYFSSLISQRERLDIKHMPMMPRQGTLLITPDEDLIQYYLDFASAYNEELELNGWGSTRAATAADGLAEKIEAVSGQLRGRRARTAETQVA